MGELEPEAIGYFLLTAEHVTHGFPSDDYAPMDKMDIGGSKSKITIYVDGPGQRVALLLEEDPNQAAHGQVHTAYLAPEDLDVLRRVSQTLERYSNMWKVGCGVRLYDRSEKLAHY